MKNLFNNQYVDSIKTNRSGAALLELGLLLPLLLCLMGGMAEFGRAFHQYHIANKGVKSAARYLARVPVGVDCATSSAAWTSKSEVVLAKSLAVSGSFAVNAPSVISNWTPADVSIPAPDATTCFNNSGGTYNGRAQIPIVTVSTTFIYDDLGMLSLMSVLPLGKKASFALTNIQITATHQEVHIGG